VFSDDGAMLVVVPDTNCLYGELALPRPTERWSALLEATAQPGTQLALAEITLMELANQMDEHMAKAGASYRSSCEELGRLGFAVPDAPDLVAQQAQLLSERSNALWAEVVRRGGRILPLPDVPLRELVTRSLARRRPFDSKDQGLRDALLWHTVLRLVTEGNDVLLISNDRKAFERSEAGGLHPALVKEAAVAGGRPDNVACVRTFAAAVERLTGPHAGEAAADSALADPEAIAEIMQLLAEAAQGFILEQPDLERQGFSNDLAGVRVLALEAPVSFEVKTSILRPSGDVLAEVEVGFRADLDGRFEDWDADLNPFLGDGQLDDCGAGLTDPHLIVYARDRLVLLCGEVHLGRDGTTLRSVELRDVLLGKPHGDNKGQLALAA
jgi:hypothetical protein